MSQGKERGFTLIEMLFSLLIFMMIATLILQILLVIEKTRETKNGINQMEWELFIQDIEREVRKSQSNEIVDNKIILSKNSQLISIGKYNSIIRRRVDYTGHEVLLHNVNTFDVRKEEHAIIISVSDDNAMAFVAEIPFVY